MGRQDAFVLDDKGRALLGKLRKGADATLSLPQLFKVLQFLGGWRIEDIVSLVPLHYESGEHGPMKYSLWVEDEARARDRYEMLKSLQVRSLPSRPKLGQLVVMDLEPFRSYPQSFRKAWGAQYNLWAAMPGYRITDPNGRSFDLLPDRHDVGSGESLAERDAGVPTIDPKALLKRLRVYGVMPWLKKETPYLDQINEALGTEHHKPGAVRTRENTGTCGACFRNVKLEPGRKLPVTVLHGYERPGTGHIEGRCAGENIPPYELSPEATDKQLQRMKAALKGVVQYLGNLKAGRVTEFQAFVGAPVVRKSDLPPVLWEKEIRSEIKRQEMERDALEAMVKVYGWLVEHWETRDLPKVGEIEFDWMGHAGRKVMAAEMRAGRA